MRISESGHWRAHPRFRHVTVAEGADAADDWIAGHIAASDIAITADVPLAARCLDKGASVIGPSGKLFTVASIGIALGMRDLNRHLREATGQETFHAGFTKQDRARFLGALEKRDSIDQTAHGGVRRRHDQYNNKLFMRTGVIVCL